ncbi:MAG: hypothetical protein WA765_01735 [Candidatus Acidiferrum sp.]
MKRAFVTLTMALAVTLAISQASAAQSSSSTSVSQQQTAVRPSQQPGPNPFVGAPAAKSEDVDSIDHVLIALYAVISGPPGERDWTRFRSLFLPGAHLTSTSKGPDGSIRVHPNTVDDYVNRGGAYFLKNGFFESPIHSRVESFGNIAQVFSSYESRHNAGEAPFARGINSLQLLKDGKRWWIVGILWDEERPDNPLPKDFATKL